MAGRRSVNPAAAVVLGFVCVSLLVGLSRAEDPVVFFDWDVSYITAAPLGVKQQVHLLTTLRSPSLLLHSSSRFLHVPLRWCS